MLPEKELADVTLIFTVNADVGTVHVELREGRRLSKGRARASARFTAAPSKTELPKDYARILGDLKQRISGERLRVVLSANAAMVLLYWDIGRTILDRQADEGWGAKVIDRLSSDLRESFPEMKGLSPRNLKYMRAFAEAWPDKRMCNGSLHNCHGDKILLYWSALPIPQHAP